MNAKNSFIHLCECVAVFKSVVLKGSLLDTGSGTGFKDIHTLKVEAALQQRENNPYGYKSMLYFSLL